MSKTNTKEVRIRVVGQRRAEPDVRRIAKAIIRLRLDADEATDRLLDLEQDERASARRRRATEAESPEKAAS
jgi:hypothetical protein